MWVALGVGACGPDKSSAADTGEGDFLATCLEHFGPEGSPLVAEVCECRVANGSATDVASCIEKMNQGGSDETACLCDYYADHPDGQAYIGCLITSDEMAADCVAAAACDEDEGDACFNMLGEDLEACPPLSEATREGVAAACPSG